ncbi:hypothetical protein FZ983_32115 [Azospirillum sp. B21]|uniref:head-tail joining protein n=1 Tax=Azospirillum sp. B21 TaxID=2607496 RepID=UPI0011EF0A8D|nr:hypothetical protein [Azospirillum sp. B21]KAA0572217.1 hypothetical protein FZ983_32115 [Azospirillum sp. B21]
MSVFDAMFGVLFADPNMASDAAYTAPGGSSAAPCRAIFRQPDTDWRGGDAEVTAISRIAEVQVSEIPVMKEGGSLTVGGKTYTIQKASRPDADRLLWRLELR